MTTTWIPDLFITMLGNVDEKGYPSDDRPEIRVVLSYQMLDALPQFLSYRVLSWFCAKSPLPDGRADWSEAVPGYSYSGIAIACEITL